MGIGHEGDGGGGGGGGGGGSIEVAMSREGGGVGRVAS